MGRLVLAWLFAVGSAASEPAGPSLARFEYERTVMSIPIKLVLYAPGESNANEAADAVFHRILELNGILSDYDAESELLQLVATAGEGKAVPVSNELWRVMTCALELARRTDGAFDPTINPVVRLWRKARREKKLPSQEKIEEARKLVGYQHVRLDPKRQTIELTKKGMRLDLGGVAKGFVCDEALALLRKRGIVRAMIVAGGDIGLGDPPPDKPGWTIGVGSLEPDAPPSQYLCLSRCGVATSGDMFQYVEIGGKRYSHIVDPKTGLGLTERTTVTVVAPNGMTADGLSTAVSVLGPDRGLRLIDDTPGATAMVLRQRDGTIEKRLSSRWKDLPAAVK
ncbi:MAG: FAD:protein FMN transferase [Thermoguttaceae bacterium]|nr:FAD:protein FMN transferase [Thermoguttaceae bacterium]